MIIDTHYHFPPKLVNEKALVDRAQLMARFCGSGGRNGAPLDASQIAEKLRPLFEPDPDAAKALRRMDEAGIDVTVVVVVDRFQEDAADVMAANRACADWAKQHPNRLIAFAGVDPRRANAAGMLRRCVEDYGMRGLKLHPDLGFYPNSPEAYILLGAAQELKVPVLFHTGPLPVPYRAKFAHPGLLDDVCFDFPELKVIAAHMGRNWWHDWAGIAQWRHNLFGDLAMWQYFAVSNYSRFCNILRDVIDWCGIEAVLFGTDAPGVEALVPNKVFVQAIRDLPSKAPNGIVFTEAEVEAILSGNAKKVLGLQDKAG